MPYLLLSCLMTSCASSPTKPPEQLIITKTVKVLPPEQYTAPCTSQPSDKTVAGELKRLDKLVRCERADKAALRAWATDDEGDPL